jgi:hypothetical protein
MNPLLFLVADKNMEYAIKGFFDRDGCWGSIGCAVQSCPPVVIVAVGQADPGIYSRADELLRPFRSGHAHVVVMVDAEWEGSPGAALIEKRVGEHIVSAGWSPAEGLALVLDPEVDAWLWSDSPHSAAGMGWSSTADLYTALVSQGFMDGSSPKPTHPKEAAEWALRQKKKPRSSALYRHIASKVSVRRCVDPALRKLLETLCKWFPRA